MCGIAGIVKKQNKGPISIETLTSMIAYLQHRGPDQYGAYRDNHCGMVNTRLSILDIAGGQQPIANEDETLWIVYNGEIYNDLDLKDHLIALGHQFRTQTDTEVILHLYETYGPTMLSYLNGAFAIAIWDSKERSLFLARDRVGIRPLFYFQDQNKLAFSSEIKAFFGLPDWQPEIDLSVLQQIFTFWGPQSPNTIFKNVFELPAGNYLLFENGEAKISPYWSLNFTKNGSTKSDQHYQEEFEALLINSAQIRLRADVPVGAYLSGGLDSSITTAIIQQFSNTPLETFSIQFSTPEYDEQSFQRQMVAALNVNHHSITCKPEDIGTIFPEVIWHAESPVLRTSPAPMFLLSKLVNQNNYKVVLTGEGADEILAGYDIFKEDYIRRFVARRPESTLRPKLFNALYPEIPQLSQNSSFLQAFFSKDITRINSPYYSHHLRWSNTARTNRFLKHSDSSDLSLSDYPIGIPQDFMSWSPLSRAQYLEMTTFLTPYLLSSQGDRMAMAHAVEGRYPFLDYRLVEFSNRLPDHLKLRGLQEKWILRKFAKKMLPREIWQRRKRPYRAPIHHSFFSSANSPDYINELFNLQSLKDSNLFKPTAVQKLVNKAKASPQISEIEEMALVGIISSQLIYHQFIQKNHIKPKINQNIPFRLVDRLKKNITAWS